MTIACTNTARPWPSTRWGWALLAPAYTHFLMEELIPLIDRTFQTKGRPSLLGVSLGAFPRSTSPGTIQSDSRWEHLVRQFWWRAAVGGTHRRRPAHRSFTGPKCRQTPALSSFFQAGARRVSDRDGDGMIDAIPGIRWTLIAELSSIGCEPD